MNLRRLVTTAAVMLIVVAVSAPSANALEVLGCDVRLTGLWC